MSESEGQFWKDMALYLADCHAATALHEGQMKSVPAGRKKRYRSICFKARAMIQGQWPADSSKSNEAEVFKRLTKAIEP